MGTRQTTRVAGGGVGRDGMGQPLRGEWEQLTELTAKLADQRTKVNFHPPYHQLDICIVFMVGLDGMDGTTRSMDAALVLRFLLCHLGRIVLLHDTDYSVLVDNNITTV